MSPFNLNQNINMKSFLSVLAVTATFCAGSAFLRGGEPVGSSPPGTGAAVVPPSDEAAPASIKVEAEDAAARVKELAQRQYDIDTAQDLYERMKRLLETNGQHLNSALPGYTTRLQSIIRKSPGDSGAKSLLVLSSTNQAMAEIDQDLAVMSHLLAKTVEQGSADRVRSYGSYNALGVDVLIGPGSSPARSLYLDGYGALFLLNVGLPLLPTPAPKAQQEKASPDSAWEQARREVYGSGGAERGGDSPVEPYSEDKVTRLRDSLLEALKNASNIRGLPPDDAITLCIFGGGASGKSSGGRPVVVRSGSSDPSSFWAPAPTAGSASKTKVGIMTIRVKKSDADAFAKGKLSAEDFRKRARIAVYAGGGGKTGSGAGSVATWGAGFEGPTWGAGFGGGGAGGTGEAQ